VLSEEQLASLKKILSKDKLTPMEMMQEAVFTELINRRSLDELQELEGDKTNRYLLGRRSPFKEGEMIIKFKQSCREPYET
jgi:hypothetical protein